MSDSVRNALFAASRRLLVPLARLLMKQGVSADELKVLVDQACVQAAQDQLTERGAVVTASRITAITGQPRYLVSSALAAGEKMLPVKRSLRASYSQRVLSGWYEDREFLTRTGDPAVLPAKGEGTTFETLVDRYGGGTRVGVIRKELIDSGSVTALPGKKLAAVRRTVSPGGADPATIAQMGEAVGALLAAFEQNLAKGPGEQLPVRGVSRAAPESVVPLFRAQMARRADVFVEMTESFLDGSVSMAKSGAGAEGSEGTLLAYVFAAALPPSKKAVFHQETVSGQKIVKSRARAAKKATAKRPRKKG
ncbi:MAG: DUF6502 family protein [Burkholderiales bacterium]